jgi:hypothetical protein
MMEKPEAPVSDAAGSDTRKGVMVVHTQEIRGFDLTSRDLDFSCVDEAKVLRKMDIRLIPILAVLYLLSFLDRGKYTVSNINDQ